MDWDASQSMKMAETGYFHRRRIRITAYPQAGKPSLRAKSLHCEISSTFTSDTRFKSKYLPCVLFCQLSRTFTFF